MQLAPPHQPPMQRLGIRLEDTSHSVSFYVPLSLLLCLGFQDFAVLHLSFFIATFFLWFVFVLEVERCRCFRAGFMLLGIQVRASLMLLDLWRYGKEACDIRSSSFVMKPRLTRLESTARRFLRLFKWIDFSQLTHQSFYSSETDPSRRILKTAKNALLALYFFMEMFCIVSF